MATLTGRPLGDSHSPTDQEDEEEEEKEGQQSTHEGFLKETFKDACQRDSVFT